ncbi:isy1-like splicing family domain-containing protein [Neospora caninum Liverpool]|uniref:Isy1-like splicing family domain-containing protein n=1 Tax=Neospora caninum (strain Liverpool) TaxID=572307 RepID=F0VF39_NEOCL|nr:isy1-like splicing family domain-containing protein [Neospora caninum Liverpool]CBZ52333.1 isy1-like splicing family domain-containing protein [Neospora caninum Liverpool]CEL66301.1 TPA: isy1-like splicing family domain-containing protein, putative [Neospora caninum Liverpool]|eukprot:XP_003882365.1 isy1-like splicing family domain-containing protein [Neospora caninum Liverpool]
MARNAERANAVLNKWLAVKDAVVKGAANRERRPRDVNSCQDLKQAEKWRSEVMREIGKMITQVQDASLGEHRIRDLNDDINRMIRVKKAWEFRIKDLGGPDYSASSTALEAMSKMSAAGADGYMYFGAAKELKGVRELLEREASEQQKPRKTRAMLFKNITPDYYGWRDEEDGEILLAEKVREEELRQESRGSSESSKRVRAAPLAGDADAESDDESKKRKRDQAASSQPSGGAPEFQSYVDVPSAETIARLLVERKKQLLLEKYVSTQQREKEKESRALASQST